MSTITGALSLLPLDVGFDLRAVGYVVRLPRGRLLRVRYMGRDNRPRVLGPCALSVVVRELRRAGYRVEVA